MLSYNNYYLTKYGITEENWNAMGKSGYLDDTTLLTTLLEFAKNSKLQDPYYKFFDVLRDVEANDKVLISHLETLDKYYHMGLINKLLYDHTYCEYYTGAAPQKKSDLAKFLKSEFSRFDYVMFHKYLSSMY